MAPVSVLIVEDEALIRHALRVFVERDPELHVVGEAGDGATAIAQAKALKPDVILMDLQLPRINGIEATRAILETLPETRILVLTAFLTNDFVIPALQAGAAGYLVKDEEPEVITRAIHTVVRNECVASPSVAGQLVAHVQESPGDWVADHQQSKLNGLSAAEVEVLDLLCQGKSNREIAKELSLSEPTIKLRLSHIMDKLGARDRVQVVVHAYQNGLVTPPQAMQGT